MLAATDLSLSEGAPGLADPGHPLLSAVETGLAGWGGRIRTRHCHFEKLPQDIASLGPSLLCLGLALGLNLPRNNKIESAQSK